MFWFWLFTLATDLLIPIVMIGFGHMFLNKPPKTINSEFGYRTTMSMKNQDTWQFAHHYCGKLWFWLGIVLLPLAIIPLLLVLGRDIEAVGKVGTVICFAQVVPMVGTVICFAQVVPMVGTIFPTEWALKKTFDKNGNRR